MLLILIVILVVCCGGWGYRTDWNNPAGRSFGAPGIVGVLLLIMLLCLLLNGSVFGLRL